MSTEHDNERWSDEVAAYALGALEDDEATAVECHLEDCERCRNELRWLQPAVRTLADGVERMQPPRRVRDSVMAEVRADAKRERTAQRGEAARAGGAPSWLSRLGGGSFGWKPALALATVALAIVAFAGYEIGTGGNGGGVQTYEKQIADLTAKVVRRDGRGTLEMTNVRNLPDNKVLEAWVERDGTVEPVPTLFVPDREGRAATTIADMDGVDAVLVTQEPKGGSEVPTSAPIVSVPIE